MIILIIEHIEFIPMRMTIELTEDHVFKPIQISEFTDTDRSEVSQ